MLRIRGVVAEVAGMLRIRRTAVELGGRIWGAAAEVAGMQSMREWVCYGFGERRQR
ncbi:hypothetical protein [Paenibacillus durus]|nr:hypothetical protein [Paenibacillus durus]